MKMKKFTLFTLAMLLSVVVFAQKPKPDGQRVLTPYQQALQAQRLGTLTKDNANTFKFTKPSVPQLRQNAQRAQTKLTVGNQIKLPKASTNARRGGNLNTYTYSFAQALNGWTTIDADGDGETWYLLTVNETTSIFGHDGNPGIATSASYSSAGALTPDNYLVSPKMKLDGKIEFYASAQDATYASEYFGVYVSTAGNTNASDFNKVQDWTMTAAPSITPSSFVNGGSEHFRSSQRVQGNWYKYEIDLSGYEGAEGYVAIRHYNCTDMFRLNVDDITLTTSELLGDYDPDLEIYVAPEGPEVVTPPAGLEAEDWVFAAYDDEGSTIETAIQVIFDGSDVYVQGTCNYLPNAWIKGTLGGDGKSITFKTGQYYGAFNYNSTFYDMYFVGYDLSIENLSDVTAEYDAESGVITWPEDVLVFINGKADVLSYYYYYSEIVATIRGTFPDPLVAPESLTTEEYIFKATNVSEDNTGEMTAEEYSIPVFVGFDGNDVWVQGVCEDMPETWIKGTLADGKVTFPTGQHFGTINFWGSVYPYYFVGYGDNGLEDVVMTIDDEKNVLTQEGSNLVLINAAWLVIDPNLIFTDVSITKIPDVAAVPAQPEITGATLTGRYPNITVNVPTTDEEGNPIQTSKLTYQYYYDIDHLVKPLTLTTDLYTELEADMTEIPYSFTDDYDVFNYRLYLNMDFSTWNKIGIQSIYHGGGVEKKSEIFWYTIREYPTPIDVIVNPENITDGDLTKALADKIASMAEEFEQNNTKAGNIIFNLTEGSSYTVSGTIKGAYDITINGNGATIDASNGDNIVAIDKVNAFAKKSDGSDSDHSYVSAITFKDVTIKGMKKALIRDLMTKTLLETLTIDNCVMEVSDQKPFIDFDGRGYVGKVVVKNSTIWAAAPTNKNFAKYGSRPKNVDEAFNQEFDIQNSTFVNIAPKPDFSGGQNLNNLKQTGTANNIYTLKNSIFVNTGKSGQVVTGFNGGQVSATPVWDVDANVFNWNGADVSANEVSKAGKKDNEDIVKNSHAGIIEFTDAANGDFNGRFTAAPVKEDAEESSRASEVATLLNCGDPRWTIEWKQGYAINIDAKFGDVTTVPADYAAEGETVTITAKPNPADKFEFAGIKVEGVNSDLEVEVTPDEENPEKFTFTMPADAVIVSATFRRIAVDIIVNPEDIEAGDIAAALDAKIASYDYTDPKTEEIIPVRVKNIYIILTPGESYTLTKTLTAPNNIMLVGATEEGDELAVINVAEGVTADVITLDGTEKLATKADGTLTDHKRINMVAITGVAVYDLQGAVVKDIQKTQLEVLAIHNAIIQMPDAQKNVIDFSGKGYVANAIVQNSTIYAEKKNTGFFAQYGSRPKNIDGNDASLKQAFIVQNSTFANIANSKNFCDLKQKGTAQNEFTIKNNIFTDCGKNGQTVVGFDGGQSSAAPQWDVDGNVFNWGGLDTSAAETTKAGQKDGEDIVKNSLAGRVEFADIAEPDLGGRMILAPGVEAPESMPGDPRWTLTTAEGFNITVIVSKDGTGSASAEYTYAAEGDEVGLTTTPAEGYEIEAIVMTDADGKLLDSVDGGSFVMPGEDVIIIVTYTKTTGIDDVTTAESEEGAWFTIKGIRIDKPVQKGLYIHNGKKVVIK